MARKKEDKEQKDKKALSASDIRKLLNKSSGSKVAFNLQEENPTEVSEWISTGSRLLDSIICSGKLGGIPVGKVIEIAGLSGVGKSYMAALISANAQKMGITVVYFDAESALDPIFLERAGCNLEELIYIQAINLEFVFEKIEELLKATDNKFLFVWDSYSMTPTKSQEESSHEKQNAIAAKPRAFATAIQKQLIPLANQQATFIILNQLKTNISTNVWEMMSDPLVATGGKTIEFPFSLRIWLTGKKGKAASVYDDNGFKIGSSTSVKIKKSRFGTEERACVFDILWGDDVRIADETYWLEAIKSSNNLTGGAAGWYTLIYADGSEEKFRGTEWLERLQDEKFRKRVYELMDEELIQKFESKEGKASQFYFNDLKANESDDNEEDEHDD